MRDTMWIYAAFILLVSEAWHAEPEANQSTSVATSTRPLSVVRHSTFNSGSDVNLTCSNRTWNETMFVIWNIYLKNKQCKIAFNNDGRSEDSCNDGKSLRNTSSPQSYLHIPNFSNDDVGIYQCESVYIGGTESFKIHVAITVPPSISSWLEREEDNMMVAVCKAERGKPAANITWSHRGNSSTEETQLDSDGFSTVESRLKLLEGMDTETLSCAIRHPYWREEKILVPKLKKGYVPWPYILSAVLFVLLAAFLVLARKKIMQRRCQQSHTLPSKSAPRQDVEEVEPYASYVQRVNSIYNSSADLFT